MCLSCSYRGDSQNSLLSKAIHEFLYRSDPFLHFYNVFSLK